MWNKEGAWGTPSPNAKPPEDSQKGHDAGPIGGNGSGANWFSSCVVQFVAKKSISGINPKGL